MTRSKVTETNLAQFSSALEKRWIGSLFRVEDARAVDARAKEYLHRLAKQGKVESIYWGWYYVPQDQKDIWDFLESDKGFKVLIKQTAASIWNGDFVHRNIYRLAVEDVSYKKAFESYGRKMDWILEVEYHQRIPYEYTQRDGLNIETQESNLVSCMGEWAFLDALATLYFRRHEISFPKLRKLARWKRVSGTSTRVWNTIQYSCNLFNQKTGKRIFNVRSSKLRPSELPELIEEAVDRVIEFA